MRRVFLDTSFFVARSNPRDKYHRVAADVYRRIYPFFGVTTEMVLVEFANAVCESGEWMRGAAIELIELARLSPDMHIVPQTPDLFDDALRLYGERMDKGFSLTDCASMIVMRRFGVTEALTADRHFVQAGFVAHLTKA